MAIYDANDIINHNTQEEIEDELTNGIEGKYTQRIKELNRILGLDKKGKDEDEDEQNK